MRYFYLISAIVLALCAAECQSVTIELSDLFGEFTSPGYPQPYNNDEDITWEITTDPGYQIVVYFTVFDLEDSYDEDLGGACVYDYIQLENEGTSKKYCGNQKNYPFDAPKSWQTFKSTDHTMTIRFVSDYSNDLEGRPRPVGFKGHYRVEDKDECEEMRRLVRTTVEDWDELVYCNHFCINTPGSYYCSCRTGFELHENQHTCKASCENLVIREDEGVIQSPDYPQPYSRLTDCDWTIQVEEGKSINFQFETKFMIENHPEEAGCVYDWLKITLNGDEQFYCNGTPYNGTFVQTNLREMRLDFHTDNALEEAGFRMTFNTTRTRCLEPRDAPTNGEKPINDKSYYEFEDEIMFECDPGYDLMPVMGALVTCQSDGTWDKDAPTCQIKSCGVPDSLVAVPNAHIVNIAALDFTYRDVLTVECDPWYELVSGIEEWWCSEDGIWTTTVDGSGDESDVPVCKPICGVKNQGRFFRAQIGRGSEAKPYEWPWMALLNFGLQPNLGSSAICGGALISSEYVLTAAHCLTDPSIPEYLPSGQRLPIHTFVWLSVHNRRDSLDNTNASSFNVAEVIRHPSYDHDSFNYDFALVRLDRTVVMGERIRPICVPSQEDEFDLLNPGDTFGLVAGWGIFSVFRASHLLLHTRLPTVTNNVCWDSFRTQARLLNIQDFETRFTNLTDKMFCAGDTTGTGGTTCQGDSGGSFMQSMPEMNKYYTLGLVSYSLSEMACGRSRSYTVFSKIDQSIGNWIRGVIENTET